MDQIRKIPLAVWTGLMPFVFFIGFSLLYQPPALNRGPYLQMATPHSMVIKWRTHEENASLKTLHWGKSLDKFTDQIEAVTTPAKCDEDCPYLDHKVLIKDLTPNAVYFYALGDSKGPLDEETAQGSFKTPPLPGTQKPIRIWVLGDSGTANDGARSVRNAYKAYPGQNKTDLWLMLGDNAYTKGEDSEYQRAVFKMYPEFLKNVPLWPTLGNHDAKSADAKKQSGPYFDIFSLPKNAEAGGIPSGTEAYYSFDYGNIHFVCLDSSDSDRKPGSPQLIWLKKDLAANKRQWTIAFFHHPPYSKGKHDSDEGVKMPNLRRYVLPILEDNGVDLVLVGHSHVYERSFMLNGHYGMSEELKKNPQLILHRGETQLSINDDTTTVFSKNIFSGRNNKGTIYVLAGNSGKASRKGNLDHPAMDVSLRTLGSLVLDVHSNMIEAKYLTDEGKVADHFTFLKKSDPIPLQLSSVDILDWNTLVVRLNHKVERNSAQNSAHYSLDQNVKIQSARLMRDQKTVYLKTTKLQQGPEYTLAMAGLKTIQKGVPIPESRSRHRFSFPDQLMGQFQNGHLPDINYLGAKDTHIQEGSPHKNYDGRARLYADGNNTNKKKADKGRVEILMAWDISSIPKGSRIKSASIEVSVNNLSRGEFHLYGMNKDWRSGITTWSSAGFPSTPDSAFPRN
jgi:hypothetical protein